jgi:transposase-like protein
VFLSKTVITEVGPPDIEVQRDRDGTFEPAIVRKHQRRLAGVDDMVLSLPAKAPTTGRSRSTWPTVRDVGVEGHDLDDP